MSIDVVKLRNWYRTPMGHTVRRCLQQTLHEMWPDIAHKRILVLGYGMPYMGLMNKEAELYCMMPARVGVMHWPTEAPNRTCLGWQHTLPFPDQLFDGILMIHALEFCEDAAQTLAECRRVLKNDGSLLIMATNRTGSWALRETSPLCFGHPYSIRQLGKLLRRQDFMLNESLHALYVPPTRRKWLLGTWKTWEALGQRFFPWLGGMVVIHAQKDLFAGRALRSGARGISRVLPTPLGGLLEPSGQNQVAIKIEKSA